MVNLIVRAIKCHQCGRVLGKIDDDGVFHVKIGKDGPQIFVRIKDLNGAEAVMVVCPSQFYSSEGKKNCGKSRFIGEEILN